MQIPARTAFGLMGLVNAIARISRMLMPITPADPKTRIRKSLLFAPVSQRCSLNLISVSSKPLLRNKAAGNIRKKNNVLPAR